MKISLMVTELLSVQESYKMFGKKVKEAYYLEFLVSYAKDFLWSKFCGIFQAKLWRYAA